MLCNNYHKWAIVWHQKGSPSRCPRHFMGEAGRGMALLFRTRAQARAYRDKEWGYFRTRTDLRGAPFHWRLPRVIKVDVTIREVA